MRDLMIVEYWNKKLNERVPVYYNHLQLGGYFNMPSARMGKEGEIGFGYASFPPYRSWNLRFQLTSHLEVSGNYRIFNGVEDPLLTQHGFGDLSDKGANLKLAIIHPEDSDYHLPGVAIGVEDFMGTRSFKGCYIVGTKVFKSYNLEMTLGYGWQRYNRWFWGYSWMPFQQNCSPLKPLAIVMEYDAIDYDDDPHPKGKKYKHRFNYGLKYRLWDHYDFSLSYIRGKELAASASIFYNFGNVKGFMPKIHNKLPYKAPVNNQPIGYLRPSDMMARDLLFALQEQGFTLLDICQGNSYCYGKTLTLRIVNNKYRLEDDVRERVTCILACLIPKNIDSVFVMIDAEGFAAQEYIFRMENVRRFAEKRIGYYELKILSPLREVCYKDHCSNQRLFKQRRDWWNLEILPKTHSLFGSAKGKFKYSFGLRFNLDGYLPGDIYYNTSVNWIFLSDIGKTSGIDILNPSQIINVHSDVIRYYGRKGVSISQAYLQKNWRLGRSWYYRAAAGLFEEEYGGVAGEALYYPLNSAFAFGVEGAILPKRTISGVGFTNKVRKLDGFTVTHRPFIGSQYFVNLYYDWKETRLDFRIKAGKFLANDYGIRYEMGRYYPSGMRVYFWYTRTNAKDFINDKRYFDKGVGISMPFDLFYTQSERSRWNYGASAWLRDVGYSSSTGQSLYYMINELRQQRCR